MPPLLPCALWAHLPTEQRTAIAAELSRIVQRSPVVVLEPDAPLYAEGETGQRVFLIKSGEMSLHMSTPGGSEVEVGERGQGSCVGVEALFFSTYQASARAQKRSHLHTFWRTDINDLLNENPALLRALMVDVLSDLFTARHRLLDLTARCATERLAELLLHEAVRGPGGMEVRLPRGSKARLSRRLGVKQETLSRLLQGFIEKGVLSPHPGGFRLPNPQALEVLFKGIQPEVARL